ncbi:MAG: trypsin-like peptidase domain-containing protein [Spirochaetaceae bacterium]|nr:trypsin-like peptidase domain-containing protein [Spirochaetaceae bacterium]
MRLYSRGQLILVGAGGIVLALLLALGLGILRLPLGQASAVRPAELLASDASEAAASRGGSTAAAGREAVLAGEVQLGRDAQLASEYSQDERENIDVYERLNEGVVNITTEVVAINWFMEPVPQDGGSGSGSIIDARGYVLTNNHVVKDAYKLFVNLADGQRCEAKVVGVDPENDLAVLKFEPPKGARLTVVPYGDSTRLKVGQKVLAIGNPFGLERTLTRGIVSGLGRPVQKDERTIIRDMIQTDASINPGNSGGPLLNSRGEIIGINTMIYTPSGGSVGVGFAVPVNTAKRIVPDLIKDGMVKRGWIEMEPVQLFPELLDYMKQNGYAAAVDKGLLVSQAKKGGNADRAGVRGGGTAVRYGRSVFYVGGDIITAVDGMKVSTMADLYSALEDNKPGDRVAVEYWRGGKRVVAEVVLADRSKYTKE